MLRSIGVVALIFATSGGVDGFSPQNLVKPAGLRSAVSNTACRGRMGAPLGLRMQEGESEGVELVKDSKPLKKGPSKLYGYGTDAATWRMTMSLFGETIEGRIGAEVKVNCKMQFREDEGFEPPQGPIKIVDDDNKFIGNTLAFWKLDEDPTKEGFDKAGFWIWGLFEEPQYPFLTFNVEVKQDIKLAEGVIPAGQLFGQAKITRDKEKGISLSEGVLTLKKNVTLKVDLLGLSEGILQDIMAVGTFTLTPE